MMQLSENDRKELRDTKHMLPFPSFFLIIAYI